MLMRSLLFVPAHKEDYLVNKAILKADILLLDIEDSANSSILKEIARKNILKNLNNCLEKKIIFPRINDRESGELLKDLTTLSVDGIYGFMYPKAKSAEDIYFIDKLLEVIEYEKNYQIGHFKLIPLIENTSAVIHVDEICKASSRIVAIAYGNEDFLVDLQGYNDENYLALNVPRALIALAARANNIAPIDTVHTKVFDFEDLKKNIEISKKLGFEGMLALNPKELEIIHERYTPSQEEYENALSIISKYENINDLEGSIMMNKNKFIGPPIYNHALQIVGKYLKAKK